MTKTSSFRSALAGLVVFALALAAVAAAPFVWANALGVKQDDALNELTLAQRRISTLKATPLKDIQRRNKEEDKSLLLSGPTEGIAAASLQSRLSNLVTTHNGTVEVLRGVPVKRNGELSRITVAISLRAKVKGFQAILHELESAHPILLVERMIVNSPAQSSGRQDRDAKVQELRVELQVAGFAMTGQTVTGTTGKGITQ